jgi:hypothetical protein
MQLQLALLGTTVVPSVDLAKTRRTCSLTRNSKKSHKSTPFAEACRNLAPLMTFDFTRPELWLPLAVVLVLLWAWIALRNAYAGWVRQRRFSRAVAAEDAAPKLLRKQGFEVLGAQVEGGYLLLVDGREIPVLLRADYVVTRHHQSYVAEVKSGRFAPKLNNANTRRQLLEYRMAFDVDGVLLVDGETEQIHEVVFPTPTLPTAQSPQYLPLLCLLGLLAIVAVLTLTRC